MTFLTRVGRHAIAASAAILTVLAMPAASAGPVPLPHVKGPLADTASKGIGVWKVGKLGYQAQEYLISGKANVDAPVSMADAENMSLRNNVKDLGKHKSYIPKIIKPAQNYTTRIVVYRPADPAKFSGNVVVEVVHPANGGSLLVWSMLSGFFIHHGDAYVAIQHPLTMASLKHADPARYGALSAVDPTQIWGMVAQTGALLRSSETDNPLKGYKVRRLYLTGYSFTGVATASFADYHHDSARLADGKPIYDGYLPFANAMYVKPLDVPVIRVNTQSDFNSFGGLNNRGHDSDALDARYRLYEVAGASHANSAPAIKGGAGAPPPIKLIQAKGLPNFSVDKCKARFPANAKENNLPLTYVLAQAFTNMYRWVDDGVAPPRTPWIKTTASGNAKLDANGNAEGGLRLPQMIVPAATYGTGSGDCMLFGYRAPFSAARMKTLYGTEPAYLSDLHKAIDHDVAHHLIPTSAANTIEKQARAQITF